MVSLTGDGGVGAWLRRHSAELRLSLRMTVAGLVAFALAELLQLAQGYWAVLTAVIVIQSSIGGSLKAGLDRLIGTIGGAVFGAVVALLIPHHTPLLRGIALVVALVPLALLSAVNASFRIAPVTAVIVLLGTSGQQDGPIGSALARVTEIGIGCIVGFAVALLVLPTPAHGLATKIAARVLASLAELLVALIEGLTAGPDDARIRELHDRVRSATALLDASAKEAQHERRIHLVSGPDTTPLVRTARRLHSDLVMLARAARMPLPEPIRDRLAPRLAAASEAIAQFLRETGTALSTRSAPPELDAVFRALDAYAATITELRREHLTRDLSDEDLGRIFALGFGLEQLRRDLDDLHSRATECARPPRHLLSGRAE